MTSIPRPVLDYWHRTFAVERATTHGDLSCAVSDKLNPKRPAMTLETVDGLVRAIVRPEIAERAGIDDGADLSADDVKDRLKSAGLAFHDPDHLFYLPSETPTAPGNVKELRQLTSADHTVFDTFYNAASEQDREDAWVELDHWAVFGYFDGDRLASAASMNLWDDSPIADLGVLTLPYARGRGLARSVVQAINCFSRQRGYEPQYRCQIDNYASVALARSCGLTRLGHWIVAADTL